VSSWCSRSDLRLELEVVPPGLGAGSVVAGELDLADDGNRLVEHGFAAADDQPLDPAEIDELAQLDQPLAGRR
jgi:hypothetical protein